MRLKPHKTDLQPYMKLNIALRDTSCRKTCDKHKCDKWCDNLIRSIALKKLLLTHISSRELTSTDNVYVQHDHMTCTLSDSFSEINVLQKLKTKDDRSGTHLSNLAITKNEIPRLKNRMKRKNAFRCIGKILPGFTSFVVTLRKFD